jgi:hypothetical protein
VKRNLIAMPEARTRPPTRTPSSAVRRAHQRKTPWNANNH